MCRRRSHCDHGFTLVELMLAVVLGCLICGVALMLLYSETRHGITLAKRTTLKQWQRRSLDLVKGDLEHASSW
nr:prepilin-type N-terminal cleavage/methylation domain-containing protein [Synechococcus sp. KORDI-52]